MSSWSWPVAILFLLLLPSARLHVFNGLPLSGLAEFAAFFLIVPLCVSGALRRIYAQPLQWRRTGSGGALRPAFFAAVLLLAIVAKLLLLAAGAGDRSGFAACYESAIPKRALGSCERSYENLFFSGGVTRFDDTIAFNPTTWNLSFFNSLRFNFYAWEKGEYDRARLAFTATWRGEIDRSATPLTLTYAGEGTLRIEGLPQVQLPPAYKRPETITLTVPEGRRAFALDYRFDDGSRIGDGPAILRGPYASMDVRVGAEPLRTIDPPLAWRALGGFVDLTMFAILMTIVWCYARLLRRDAVIAVVACVGGVLLAVDPTVTMRATVLVDYAYRELGRGLPGGIGLTLFAGTLFVLIARRPSSRLLLLAFLAIGWASAFRQDFFLHGFHTVNIRDGGDDWLTYESFARSILETGTLEAGEPVFYYQPLFRYIVFLAHAALGDGDTLIALMAQALLIWSIFFMSARLLPRDAALRGKWRALGIAIGLFLLVLVTSDPVSRLIYAGASEYPSWIAFPLLFPLLIVAASRRDWRLGTFMLGLTLITRMNHAIALAWMFIVHLWRIVRVKARPRFAAHALQSILMLLAIAALPSVHNLYYGGHLSVLPEEHAVSRTLPMPPSRWLRVFEDGEAKKQALLHLGAVTYTSSIALYTTTAPTVASHVVFMVACRGLQAAWVLAVILLFWPRPAPTNSSASSALVTAKLLLILPVLYLAVHLFYQVQDYHPRFIVIGYLAMGAVAMLAVREHGRAVAGRGVSGGPRRGQTPAGD